MKEYNIEVEINSLAEIVAETQGVKGAACVDELNRLLQGLLGDKADKKKEEFYMGQNTALTTSSNKKNNE